MSAAGIPASNNTAGTPSAWVTAVKENATVPEALAVWTVTLKLLLTTLDEGTVKIPEELVGLARPGRPPIIEDSISVLNATAILVTEISVTVWTKFLIIVWALSLIVRVTLIWSLIA